MTSPTPPIRAVVFDAYGTLFDVYSIGALAETLYPGQGAALSVLWRDKQIEYTRLISLSDPSPQGSRYYQSFWDITRASLRYALARLGLVHTSGNEDALMAQYAQLSAFPENLGVLQALRQRGVATAILSNGSPEMLQSAVHSAGMSDLLDAVLSVDSVRQFKTTPTSYQLVQDHLGLAPADVLFVSSNAWDALGATWFGFTTLWINRQGLPPEAMGPAPHHTGRDLSEVLKVLGLH
ncbi:haloacid dehalogenase type II [Limnohabitans sp. Rim8]|uniref:haloacid dehalogenase type II n=1 Tax=Limnohabitans sp. Rim8 TaxID=1100718 RepID=UPI0025FE68B3|nr:haloacid dehalogenase type II [Limnohabitans sp. Rim8]